MFSDQADESADSRILPFFSEKDLDADSINQYRNRFSARKPNHPWLRIDVREFLERLGGWKKDRQSGQEGITVAGLLMFGTDSALRSSENGLKYYVDYRERRSDRIADRWDDRLIPDGTWTPNLFQFFQKVYPKLVEGLKLPFAYLPIPTEDGNSFDLIRQGFSPAHEAVQEALVNALIHTDYYGQGGIVIERFRDRLELNNPGTLLISREQWRSGGYSECRNPLLQLMFQFLGAGDRAGSGIDKIRQGWASQKWRLPDVQVTQRPDRVRLLLPVHPSEDSIHSNGNSIHSIEDSIHSNGNSIHSDGDSIHSNGDVLRDPKLLAISALSREKKAIPKEETRKIIRQLCQDRHLTLSQISGLLDRNPVAIRNHFIQEMLRAEELIPLHAEPNHPQQAYKTNPDWHAK